MIIEHDDDLRPFHVVTQYDPRFVADLAARHDNWLHLAEAVPHGELQLERHPETGAVQAFHAPPGADRRLVALKPRLRTLAITGPATVRVGQEARFAPVPSGTRIIVNGQPVAVMDDSGAYELEPGTAATWHLRFDCDGFRPLEVTLEATA